MNKNLLPSVLYATEAAKSQAATQQELETEDPTPEEAVAAIAANAAILSLGPNGMTLETKVGKAH